MTTALLRQIDRQDQARVREAWEDRRLGHDRRPPVWAVDRLLATGVISAEHHDAAQVFARAIDRSQPGGAASAERVDGSWHDPHASAWDAAQSAYVARTARSWIFQVGGSRAKTMPVLDALFAFDGHASTGPRPTFAQLRRALGLHASTVERRVVATLDQLADAIAFVDAHPFTARMRLPDARRRIIEAAGPGAVGPGTLGPGALGPAIGGPVDFPR